MFASVERMLDGAAAAVYSFGGPRGTRMVIGDWQGRGGTLARHTGEYVVRYAANDPARRALREGCVVTTCLAREELPHPGHRALLEEAGFSLARRHPFPRRAPAAGTACMCCCPRGAGPQARPSGASRAPRRCSAA